MANYFYGIRASDNSAALCLQGEMYVFDSNGENGRLTSFNMDYAVNLREVDVLSILLSTNYAECLLCTKQGNFKYKLDVISVLDIYNKYVSNPWLLKILTANILAEGVVAKQYILVFGVNRLGNAL